MIAKIRPCTLEDLRSRGALLSETHLAIVKTILFVLSLVASSLPVTAAEKIKSEIELQAEPSGINYDRLEKAARKGHPDAVRVLLALHFDGGGGEMFLEHRRPDVLRGLKDGVLSEALAELSPAARREIVESMTDGLDAAELKALQRRLPKSLGRPAAK
jgi:hypothetical protein